MVVLSDFWNDPHSGVDRNEAAKTSAINEKDFDVGIRVVHFHR
jgi:hypothetical protein